MRKSPYAHVTVDKAAVGVGGTFTMTMTGDVHECVDANDKECILGVEWDYPFTATGQYRLLRETGTFFASSGQATVAFSTTRPPGFGYYMPFSLQADQPNSDCQFGQPFGRPLNVTPTCTYRIIATQLQTPAAWVVVYPAVVVRLANGTTREDPVEVAFRFLTEASTNAAPVAAFDSQPGANDSLTVNFDGSTSTDDKGIDRYEWDFGDGQTGTGFRPTHPYAGPGTYPVKLTVFDAEGLSNTVQHDVIVRELSLTVNAATPQLQGVRRGQRIAYTLDAQPGELASSLSLSATLRPDLVDVDQASITGGGVLSADHTTIDWTFSNTVGTNPAPTFEVTVRGDAPDTTQFIPLDVKAHATLTSGRSAASTIKLVPLFATRSITIVEQTVPLSDPQNFSFMGSAPIGVFTLDTDANSAQPDQRTFNDLDVGSYTVSEAVQDGWGFDSVTCTDPSGGTTTDNQARRATIDLSGTDSVTCAFHSTRLQRPLIVNSTGDARDDITGDDCDTGSTITRNGDIEPECTLRAAIQEAEARPGADTIGFNIPGGGVPVIAPRAELPPVKGPVTIDGSTQPGGLVELLGTSGVGISLDGSGCVIRGLMIDGFDIGIGVRGSDHEIVGNSFGIRGGDIGAGNRTGIQLFAADHVVIGGDTQSAGTGAGNHLLASDRAIVVGGGRDVRIEGNLVEGSDRAVVVQGASQVDVGSFQAEGGNKIVGSDTGVIVESVDPAAVVNRVIGNSIDARVGVSLPSTAQRVVVGGAAGNPGVAPGNTINAETGVLVDGEDNTIAGNLIDRVGPNGGTGIWVRAGTGTIIGGSTLLSGNRIAGYAGEQGKDNIGINVTGIASDTRVSNNVVGVAADGRTAAPNGIGVLILGPNTTLENNVVSGNGVGVSVGERTTVVRGNRIGTDVSGSFAIPNGRGLIASGAVIGGAPTAQCDRACNLISGNAVSGVQIDSGRFEGNFVGTDVTGTQPIPNGIGVVTKISAGPTSVSENLIAFNSGAGILASGSQTRAEFRSNRIFGNGGLGIDLTSDTSGEPDGVTQNGTSSGRVGPNALQNFPVIAGAARQADGRLLVQGQLSALSLTATYAVDLYWNRTCDQPSGHGEGEVFAASTSIPGLGLGAFEMVVTQPEGSRVLTATATGPTGTSEFSACFNLLPQTALSAAAPAGANRLVVASNDGFLGKVVDIGTGPTKERNLVTAIGSLVLAKPLRFAHTAGEPVVAVDDSLFVSVDRASIATSSKLPDVFLGAGTVNAADGHAIACSDDATLHLDGTVFTQMLPGSKLTGRGNGPCVYAVARKNGFTLLVIDPRRGTWDALVVASDLERLTNPVEVALTVGNKTGGESLFVTTTRGGWTYRR